MNDLSWLIYFAEVSDRASGVLGFIAFMWLFVGLTLGGLSLAIWADEKGSGWIPVTVIPVLLLIEAVFVAGSVALPSKSTIYMIAASEAGEAIATTPDAIEMMGDLKAIIKKRLKEELAE